MRQLSTLLILFVSISLTAQNLEQGIKQFENNEYDKALKTLKAIKSDHPNYEKALFFLGKTSFALDEYSDARDYFKKAIKIDGNVSQYHTWLGNSIGRMAQSAGKLKQGMLAPKIKNAYKRATELDPGDMDAQWGLMEFYSQAPGMLGGSWEKALEAAEAVYKIDPIEGHRAKATVYNRKEDYDLAEQEYVQMAKLDDRYLYTLGLFYQGRQKFEHAFQAFEDSWTKTEDNYASLYQIGRNSALSGLKAERGIECLTIYLEEDRGENLPSHSAAKSRMAMIYEKQGNITKAKSLYEEALKDDPKMNLAQDGLKRIKK